MRRWYFANHSTVLIFHNFSLKFSLRNLLTIFEFYAQHYIGRTRLIGMHSPFRSILTDIDNIWRGTETIFGTDFLLFIWTYFFYFLYEHIWHILEKFYDCIITNFETVFAKGSTHRMMILRSKHCISDKYLK